MQFKRALLILILCFLIFSVCFGQWIRIKCLKVSVWLHRLLKSYSILHYFAFIQPQESYLQRTNTEILNFLFKLTGSFFSTVVTRNRQNQSMCRWKELSASSPLALWHETDSFASLSTTHSSSLTQQPRKGYICMIGMVLQNLAAICRDIFSFHVFQLGHLWKRLLLHTWARTSPGFIVIVLKWTLALCATQWSHLLGGGPQALACTDVCYWFHVHWFYWQ